MAPLVRQMFSLCLLTIAFLVILSVNSTAASSVEVTISNGTLIGEVIVVPLNRSTLQLDRFLGIPYAQPPVGGLRFRKALPLTTKWRSPYLATSWPNNCVQKVFFAELYQNGNFTEDCLYLNVWSPSVKALSLRPVLVWIHGGSFHVGGSSWDMYNGEVLAAKTNAVLVTFNYRVSTLGFLYADDDPEIGGNQGMWDQVLALKWIQENIRHFGGDPQKVTIMGESAGSQSVSLHLLSPVSRDLFQKAIMMSGSALMKVVMTPAQMVKDYLVGIRQIGCATAADTKIDRKVMQCLQTMDPQKVDEVTHLIRNQIDYHELVVIDGDFLPVDPGELLLEGNHKRDVSLLVSTVEDEGSFFLAFSGHNPQFGWQPKGNLTLSEATDYFLEFMSGQVLPGRALPNATLLSTYFSSCTGKGNGDRLRKQVGIAYGDGYFGCPTLEFAKSFFRSSPDTVKVYQWYYTFKSGPPKMCPPWAGACHSDDLYAMFGLAFRKPDQFLPAERDISQELISLVKSFIEIGNPSKANWEPYHLSPKGDVLAPYYTIGSSSPRDKVKVNLKQQECDTVWKPFILP